MMRMAIPPAPPRTRRHSGEFAEVMVQVRLVAIAMRLRQDAPRDVVVAVRHCKHAAKTADPRVAFGSQTRRIAEQRDEMTVAATGFGQRGIDVRVEIGR